MSKNVLKAKIFEARYFSFVIGFFIFLLLVNLRGCDFVSQPQKWVQDLQMNQKTNSSRMSISQGTNIFTNNTLVNPNISIAGVGNAALNNFGQWPWPRHRHAAFLDFLAHINDQSNREESILLDFFFLDPSQAGNDVLLANAIKNNGKVQLEMILNSSLDDSNQSVFELYPWYKTSFDNLIEKYGSITKVTGDFEKLDPFFGVETPLKPFTENLQGYGFASYIQDSDKVLRRALLVARVSLKMDEIDIDKLKYTDLTKLEKFQHYSFKTSDGFIGTLHANSEKEFNEKISDYKNLIPYKLIAPEGAGDYLKIYYIRKYQDVFVPSIVLSIVAHHFHVKVSDIEFVPGKYIKLPNVSVTNEKNELVPYIDIYGKEQKDVIIPIDERGQMVINYAGGASSLDDDSGANATFNIFSYDKYPIEGMESQDTLAMNNKIIMAGAFTEGMADDIKTTPFGRMFGIEMQANALNTVLMGNYISYLPEYISILIVFLLIMIVALVGGRLSAIWAIVISFPLIALIWCLSIFVIFPANSLSVDVFLPTVGMALTLLLVIVWRVVTEENEKKRIHGMFGKYVSPAVVSQLLDVSSEPELGGVDKEITVFFSDIRGFTTLSESMSPQELVNHLNLYLTAMTDIIHEFNGTLDKYVGDEIMCFWGAPISQAEHAILACKCALKQMAKLNELNSTWPAERRIDIGIGINSGIMTVGNMGSLGRMNYTLMGDNVNLGARLEGTNKEYATHIIISEFTYQMVKDRVIVRELDNIRVKGKNKPVQIYELVDVLE